jgi:arylsulfatase A-like enzyme
MGRFSSFATAASILAIVAGGIGGGTSSCSRPPHRPNVLVLLLDTLRADHLGVYGYARATSPNIDRFAKENWNFTRTFTSAPWTPPAVATVLSGLYATSHGMMPPDETPGLDKPSRRLDEKVLTMAEILKGAGYRTAAFSSNPWITPEFGFGQGFDAFDVEVDARADVVTDAGLARIDALRAEPEPFFVYLHYLDPHGPYTPPSQHMIFEGVDENPRYDERTARQIDHYDAEIHCLDAGLGRLFAGLKERGVWDDLVVVLIGDHGEQFGERGHFGHGWQLYNEELRVPLVLKPGRTPNGRSIDRVASNVDLLPTVLAQAGVEVPAGLPGVSLLDDAGLAARRGVFSEIERKLSFRSFVDASGKKLIVDSREEEDDPDAVARPNPADKIVGLYDAAAADEPAIEDEALRKELRGELLAILDRVNRAKITPISNEVLPSAETIERLRALGYVK